MDPNRTQALSADPNRTQLGAPPVIDPNKTVMGGPSLNATQIIKPVQCPVCKTFNPAGVMFCVECGLIFDRALPEDAFGAPTVQLPKLMGKDGREFVIRPGDNVVGRDSGEIALSDGRVSRKHAVLRSENGGFALEDAGSTNGTTVDGLRITGLTPVSPGQTIGFGGIEFQIQLPGGAPAAATQAFASNTTAAIVAPPKLEAPAAVLEGIGLTWNLKKGTQTFGRKAENDVQINDPYVSGKHGILEIADDGWFITDLGSTNGTSLNDARLAPNMRTRVTADDLIKFGALEFRLRAAE